ncbi:Bax inhibitor-1/YccA family protein [Cryobacterium psychrophilum]|uniref:Bax inhibitor-1/YccA family protein n=1 Tax=Cryobacterium psychrophilum TaxID=41988 RepID=A0A4Y8KTD3_9MICO|nr:Bax inhibitor-1/YccA family protein [Cryobacterium psychrophilum]TDW29612.1 putative YccA/Bax inhibitor family protein [Cryobacterium psychrophilum]TFD81738.1 Bax inhibitor-1/YccA family protein [Cryobacterium psychrophilum]
MASSNPAFSRNAAFGAPGALASSKALSDNDLQTMYDQPSAGSQNTDRMTYEDTIGKTGLSFALLLVAAAIGWIAPILVIPGAIIGLVLGLVNTFKKEPSAPLILMFAGAQGLFVGGISNIFEAMYPGVVVQAVLATLVVVGVTLALFRSGKIRASKKATKVFTIAMVGYGVFSLINVGMMIFGGTDQAFGLRSQEFFGIPLGLIIGVLAVVMAAYSLVLDFDFVQKGVNNRVPRKYGWSAAFGIVLTVVWLYIEMLRIFAIARD